MEEKTNKTESKTLSIINRLEVLGLLSVTFV